MRKEIQRQIEQEKLEQEFFNVLLEMNYSLHGVDSLMNRAQLISKKLSQYNEWPKNKVQFWNAEALHWKTRIDLRLRHAISQELSFLNGHNLDLGSGSFSYVKNSVVSDISKEMLHLNDCDHKVVLDLEEKLPFDSHLFDSVTMAFVANYVENLPTLFSEISRVLKHNGTCVLVQASRPVTTLHKIHYKNSYGHSELRMLMGRHDFRVKSYEKTFGDKTVHFLVGEKVTL